MCTDPGCGLVFKTLQTINRFIVRPVTPDELAESLHEKTGTAASTLKKHNHIRCVWNEGCRLTPAVAAHRILFFSMMRKR